MSSSQSEPCRWSRVETVELIGDSRCDGPPKVRGDRIAELKLLLSSRSEDREAVGERHQPLDLGDAKAPVVPMERTHPGARLSLDGWRGFIRVKLQEEAPIA